MTATTHGRANARQAEWLQCIMSGPGAKLRMGVAIAEVTKPVIESHSRKFSMTPLLLLIAFSYTTAAAAVSCKAVPVLSKMMISSPDVRPGFIQIGRASCRERV